MTMHRWYISKCRRKTRTAWENSTKKPLAGRRRCSVRRWASTWSLPPPSRMRSRALRLARLTAALLNKARLARSGLVVVASQFRVNAQELGNPRPAGQRHDAGDRLTEPHFSAGRRWSASERSARDRTLGRCSSAATKVRCWHMPAGSQTSRMGGIDGPERCPANGSFRRFPPLRRPFRFRPLLAARLLRAQCGHSARRGGSLKRTCSEEVPTSAHADLAVEIVTQPWRSPGIAKGTTGPARLPLINRSLSRREQSPASASKASPRAVSFPKPRPNAFCASWRSSFQIA